MSFPDQLVDSLLELSAETVAEFTQAAISRRSNPGPSSPIP